MFNLLLQIRFEMSYPPDLKFQILTRIYSFLTYKARKLYFHGVVSSS